MHNRFKPAKLLITIVGRQHGELIVATTKEAGAPGGTKSVGRGMPENNTRAGSCHDDLSEDIIFSLMGDETERVVQAVVKASAENPEQLSGMAILLAVPNMLARPHESDGGGYNTDSAQASARSEHMTSGTTLITSIITHGQADEVMAAARQAGARGGTILNARGTGTQDDVKFFGISLAPEKEMLFIVADNEYAQPIMEAVSSLSIFNEPGGGIIFTTSVEQFIVLGK